jgi:hypothetical protein
MGRILFDIETAGKDFDSLEKPVRDYLLRWAETEQEKTEVKESLSLFPLTGEIIAIGMLNPDTGRGTVLFQNNKEPLPTFEEDGLTYESGTEEEILGRFWSVIRNYDGFVTFNGRCFDCPFIMVRSAVHRIKPLKDLMPNRYADSHIDLLDRLTFYGAFRRKFSLDMWCRIFGISSPKANGITGHEVGELYQSGKYLDIARYCAGDIRATAELLSIWENYIRFSHR